MIMPAQSGILSPDANHGRFLTFSLARTERLPITLSALQQWVDPQTTVIGIGSSLAAALQREIPGLRPYSPPTRCAIDIPATPSALWCWLRGEDRGELLHRSRQMVSLLNDCFSLERVVDAFQYDEHRDLSGYIDGTENPQGDNAVAAAVVTGQGSGLDGGSFVAVQQWQHDFAALQRLGSANSDLAIGRRLADNAEIGDAPVSAHVKRTAQESFEPAAFILRRSMPWANQMAAGLYFVAFGHSLDAFEAQLRRMLGLEDGISDALFQFTRPLSSAYFWCPPEKNARLDLQRLLG